MSQDSQPQKSDFKENNSGEVDLIAIFEYFKNGFKSFGRGISNFLNSILSFLFLLIQKWYILLGFCLVSVVVGYAYKYYISSKNLHQYEMITESKSTVNLDLYLLVSQLNSQTNQFSKIHQKLGLSQDEVKSIQLIKVEPLKIFKDEVENYYDQLPKNTFRSNNMDTVFYKEYEIKDFQTKMLQTDYPKQKITIVTNKAIDPHKFQLNTVKYFEENPVLNEKRQLDLTNYDSLISNYNKNLVEIRSLLSSYSKRISSGTGNGGSQLFIENGNTKENIEKDLLDQSNALNDRLYFAKKEKEEAKYIIKPVANLQEVEFDDVLNKGNSFYIGIGLLAGCLFILILELIKNKKKVLK